MPKRKCHRIDAEINFDRLVYTRTQSEIDLLFQPTPEFCVVFPEDIAQAISAPKGNLSTSPQHIDLSPKRLYTVGRLIMEGKETAKRGVRRTGIATEGYTGVDTSGCCKNWEAWKESQMLSRLRLKTRWWSKRFNKTTKMTKEMNQSFMSFRHMMVWRAPSLLVEWLLDV